MPRYGESSKRNLGAEPKLSTERKALVEPDITQVSDLKPLILWAFAQSPYVGDFRQN